MSKFFLVIFIFSTYVYSSGGTGTSSCSNGMGTVLFTSSDVHKQCWSPDEIALLTTRMILEDLLPDIQVLNIDSDAYVDDIVDYFRLLIEVVKSSTCGRKKHIMLLALTDLLGGYLQHAVLPIARYAYYAGLVDFFSMEKLIELYEELKWFLRTNGQGWSKPIVETPVFDIETITFNSKTCSKCNASCCSKLIYYERETKKKNCSSPSAVEISFPLPFFDSKVMPSAIAVPFRKYALRNIESRKAAYLVEKFFISAYQCLQDKHQTKEAINRFLNKLYGWILSNVIPKLKDDKFYSAFGGIWRVEQTLKSLGAQVTTDSTCKAQEADEEVGVIPVGTRNSRSSIVLLAMLIIIIIWFIIGTTFICYRMKRNPLDRSDKHERSRMSTSTSSFCSSKWSLFSKTTGTNISSGACKCATTATGKSTAYTSSPSSEYESKDEYSKSKPLTVCYPPQKPPNNSTKYNDSSRYSHNESKPNYHDSKPAQIETKHSMKKLPSITEMSENTSSIKDDDKNQSRKLSFDRPLATSSREDTRDVSTKKKLTFSKDSDLIKIVCPKYSDKDTSMSSSRTKSTAGKEFGTQISDPEDEIDECWCNLDPEEQRTKIAEHSTRQTKDDTFASGKDHSTRHTKDDTFASAKDHSTRQTAKDDTFASAKDHSTRHTKDDTFASAKDHSTRQTAKDDTFASAKDHSTRHTKDDTFASAKDQSLDESTRDMEDDSVLSPADSTDDTGVTATSPHIYACHSGLTGEFLKDKRRQSIDKPYIFGYDFQTSSSDVTDEDTDIRTSTSK